MPDAVKYYRELTTFRKAEYRAREKAYKKLVADLKRLKKPSDSPAPPQDYISADDYVFMPQYENRSTALEKLGKIFALIIETSGLEKKRAKNLTLYSLRHTAIMYRLMNSDIDSLALAKNARTSQAVIERFYGSHLTTEHVRKKLHSFKQVG